MNITKNIPNHTLFVSIIDTESSVHCPAGEAEGDANNETAGENEGDANSETADDVEANNETVGETVGEAAGQDVLYCEYDNVILALYDGVILVLADNSIVEGETVASGLCEIS